MDDRVHVSGSNRAAGRRFGTGLLSLATLAAVLAFPASAVANSHNDERLTIDVLSSAPDQVTGGDALIRVRLGRKDDVRDLRVTRNGSDVTTALTWDNGTAR